MSAARQTVAWQTAVWVLGMSCGSALGAAVVDEPSPSPGPSAGIAVRLEFQELPYSFLNQGFPIDRRSAPFEREPNLKASDVSRGAFRYGAGARDRLDLAWDKAEGKLYLDLNHNGDLTDDPSGVFTSASQRGARSQTFDSVRLPVATAGGTRSALITLSLYTSGTRLFASAGLRSLWLGKGTLSGSEWQVGIVESPFGSDGTGGRGQLLLRPWADRDTPFQVGEGGTPVFGLPANLFLDDRAYALTRTDAEADGKPCVTLGFAEQQPRLGELRVTGAFIQRLVLEGDPYLVVLHQPGPSVRIPLGRYTDSSVQLRGSGVEAFLKPRRTAAATPVTVSEPGGSATLVAGGPLTNSVTVRERGRELNFDYQLLGGGGEAYQLARPGPARPPEFAVYQGGKRIASGKFEFG